MLTATQLDALLGKPIKDICPNGFANANDNHCAHFVSHVLGFGFGLTCRTMSSGKEPGANIRVQELFAKCPEAGAWADKPAGTVQCLVFVTAKAHVHLEKKTMDNVPRKHVGIFVNGTIWHYSNLHSQVASETPEVFVKHYNDPGTSLFYGTFPAIT